MSEYKVLARKYRPQLFHDVIAQSVIVATLKNAIVKERTAHAYLFCGCRGTGKTTLARLFAKALNCKALSSETEPCNNCPSCRDIAAGHSIDVLEIDGASHRGIEDIRQINETIGFAPTSSRYKIYLIDEVHMLTKEAFNALLKTLEEPPPHVKFFFCTTEPHKIPPTILSRCQRFNLRRIPTDKMADKLLAITQDSGATAEREALETLAEMSEGSLRDALSLLDQILAFEQKKITTKTVAESLGLPSKDLLFSLTDEGAKNNLTAAFTIAEELFSSGKNLSFFLEELITHFRKLLLIKNGIKPTGQASKIYEAKAPLYRLEQLIHILELITDTQSTLKNATSERTALEMLLLKILRTHAHVSLESLVERLISLEKGVTTTAPVAPSPPPRQERASITEDPTPKPEELPKLKPKPIEEKPKPAPAKPLQAVPVQEQSRFDTIVRFAAKELNATLESNPSKLDSFKLGSLEHK